MAKLKSEAGLSYNWNSLFLGQNAVADIMAKTYNTTKENVNDILVFLHYLNLLVTNIFIYQVLTGDNAAVRLALGESQIVSDTKTYLENHGVKLDIFNQVCLFQMYSIYKTYQKYLFIVNLMYMFDRQL